MRYTQKINSDEEDSNNATIGEDNDDMVNRLIDEVNNE